tara:strand:- start:1058 stop:1261 length:204 start_codon:yes stop_codon:yes gene_type:complete
LEALELLVGAGPMKVGDLVTWSWGDGKEMGVVIEVGIYTGNKDIKVFWDDSVIMTERRNELRIVNEK